MTREVSSLKETNKMFVPITYKIDCGKSGQNEVAGFAFETPGWPEFHACVRFGNRWGDDLFTDWVVDHYETGLAVSNLGEIRSKEEAPAAVAKRLNGLGKTQVAIAMQKYGL